MLPTLFYIPDRIVGLPVFGWGLLLAAVAALAVVSLAMQIRRNGLGGEFFGNAALFGVLGFVVVVFLPSLVEPGFGLPIRGYGVFLLLAAAAAVYVGRILAAREGFDPELFTTMAFWLFAAGVAGGRLFYVIQYWDAYPKENFAAFLAQAANFAQGGLVVFGGVIGAAGALVVFCRLHKLPLLDVADAIAPSTMLAQSIGRIGCFLSGCCFAGACTQPWAVTFPYGSPVFQRQIDTAALEVGGLAFDGDADGVVVKNVAPDSPAASAGLQPGDVIHSIDWRPVQSASEALARLAEDAQYDGEAHLSLSPTENVTLKLKPERSNPVHPVQLYSAIDAALLFAVLWFLHPLRKHSGQVAGAMLACHAVSRFVLETIRIDEAAALGTQLTISQNLSIVMFIGGVLLWLLGPTAKPGRPAN